MQLSTDHGVRQARVRESINRLTTTRKGLQLARKLLKDDVAASSIWRTAQNIGLSRGCIANIVNDVTREPRFSTLLLIYRYYGMTLQVTKS